ncbi:LysM domain-containing protein [Hathewaya proteolytica DSM 3090]|uniref:LysM domain-containing protein n=1 Tax=Hathewaya proteolytica DSM 3090 TaxID=1121331 RepID=A0A1M6N4B9_9CLOT|nr:LysM peptidoglycan-binding domain-containing protein [Hathewaya proteolytica]SHJ90540.1 LysM domain-containing protein [Hathewaya proteolytica DSM 3090]
MRNSKNIRVLFSAMVSTLMVTSFLSINVQALDYTVQQGDSLYKIGQRYNISYENIMKDNNLKSTLIYPGQKLYVNDNVKVTYTVVKGDSLYKIAKKYGTTVQAIKSLNNLKSDMIYPGQVFVIKGSNTPSTTEKPENNVVTPKPVDPNEKFTSKSGVSYTQSELDLLSRLIKAEAGGESYNTQLAVGAVVINRVKNAGFPNTIKDVIYEVSYGYYQFTPVLNGEINKPGNEQSLNAAKEALNGTDPTNGALYFFDNTVTNNWLLSKPRALVEKNMIFAY